jgi:hypothetical protein
VFPPNRTVEALEATLEGAIPQTLQVIADALEEAGEPLLALAYRWMGEQGKIPMWRPEGWYWRSPQYTAGLTSHSLPARIGGCLHELYGGTKYQLGLSATITGAYRQAAQAIAAYVRSSLTPIRSSVELQTHFSLAS